MSQDSVSGDISDTLRSRPRTLPQLGQESCPEFPPGLLRCHARIEAFIAGTMKSTEEKVMSSVAGSLHFEMNFFLLYCFRNWAAAYKIVFT